MLSPDTVLQSRYRIIRKLGEGGMGSVYLAIDERFDSEVAIKESHFTDETSRRQFEREARLLNKLRHPAMTKVIDHFTERDGQFLVMELIGGEDLWEMLQKRGGAFPQDKVLEWADQLLDALCYLHKQDPPIIHRDIKPQNLKLSDTGQIILLDFGLAKGTLGQSTSIMTSRSVYGYTPVYAPLEQITAGGTDPRSDIYSLGATLYHLITGNIPTDAPTRFNALEEGRDDPLRPAHEVNPEITSEVSDILKKAMAVSRRERIASAVEMRNVLRKARESLPPSISEAETIDILQSTISSPARAMKAEEAKPLPLTVAAIAEKDKVPSSTVASPTALPHTPLAESTFPFDYSPSPFARPVPKSKRLRWIIGVAALFAVGIILALAFRQSAENKRVIVGSKDFTEEVILGEIMAQMLEAKGLQVERRFELGGNLAHESLVKGDIDLYPEYTGTSYTSILKHPPITDKQKTYQQVKEEYEQQFNVKVSQPLGFSNDYAILIRGSDAQRLSLKTISDAVQYARSWKAGFGQDFMSRADGYPGFTRAYNLKFASQPREMDLSLTYRALASGEVDLIAGNSTDGLIKELNLFQLEDDRHYFQPYEAVVLIREDTLTRAPVVGDLLVKLHGAISQDDMRALNYEVDRKKRRVEEVAREWIKSKGL